MVKDDRIFSFDWDDYTADKVIYRPKHMSPETLQGLLDYAWDTFYADESQEIKMSKLFQKVVLREMRNNTHQKRERSLAGKKFGRNVA
jgi:hypothetical protein